MDSDFVFHAMRDHPRHDVAMLGGMWCFKNDKNRVLGRTLLTQLLKDEAQSSRSTKNDQVLLERVVWPRIQGIVMHHDAYLCHLYPGARPFPTKRNRNGTHVGCIRPCTTPLPICPEKCRPQSHLDWIFC